jgi:asparagine synthase (glutamine-hydrolysing)
MLPKLRGMYALAIWDDTERTLLLARDPYGIKPLYVSRSGGCLRFASQVKGLAAGGRVADDVDATGLVGFLLWGSVPEPWTLLRGVRSLRAGHSILVRDGVVGPERAHHAFDDGGDGAAPDPVDALEASVRAHLVADVPVGLFLSAGLDSSLIAALAQRSLDEPLTTLTLRFEEFAGTPDDEGPLAGEVARALGTRHVERLIRREDFLDLWPRALEAMDQPSIDGFNTYVVSRAAREEGFKVVLSGLGGDELFGSYPSFHDVPRWRGIARCLGRVPGLGGVWPSLARRLRPGTPKLEGLLAYGASTPGAYFLRRALFLPEEVARMVGRERVREALEEYDPVEDAGRHLAEGAQGADDWRAVHVMESTRYMRNQLLRDSDWASMAHSLELRVPLVDARLRQAFAAAEFEPARGQGKAAIVRRAAPELPATLWDRPKSGFSIPVLRWIDEAAGIDTTRGQASRLLAVEVLRAFGVDLGADAARGRASVA